MDVPLFCRCWQHRRLTSLRVQERRNKQRGTSVHCNSDSSEPQPGGFPRDLVTPLDLGDVVD
jgi:hypothetical protein